MHRLVLLLPLTVAACDRGPAAAPEPSAPIASPNVPAAKPLRDNGVVDRSQAGLAAPDATFRDGEGETRTLADFSGRPVLLNLWATWCAPCVAELPTLDALAGQRAGRLSVVTVSQDNDTEDAAGKTLTAAATVDAFFTKARFKQLGAYGDSENALMTQLGVQILPTTILYDAAGKEVWRMTGELDWTGDRARKLLVEAG